MPGPGHTVNLPSEIRESSRLERRFSWSANVPITNDPPAYVVSAADWLTLVEKSGLAAHLEDSAKHG